MLFHRILTALVLLPLVIAAVLFLPQIGFALLLAVVILLAAGEWTRLAALTRPSQYLLFLGVVTAGMIAGWFLLAFPEVLFWLFLVVGFGWLIISLKIILYRPETARPAGRWIKFLLGLFVLLPTWIALVKLHGDGIRGPELVLFTLSLSWVADTGAYFAGRAWGRVKLAPHVSPKKTWEGVYGALVAVGLWSGLLYGFRPESGAFWQLLLLCLVVCLVSVIGDLFESLMKREAGLKDSGNLLPGHGGILDRIDSLTAVAPVFSLGLLLLGGGG